MLKIGVTLGFSLVKFTDFLRVLQCNIYGAPERTWLYIFLILYIQDAILNIQDTILYIQDSILNIQDTYLEYSR